MAMNTAATTAAIMIVGHIMITMAFFSKAFLSLKLGLFCFAKSMIFRHLEPQNRKLKNLLSKLVYLNFLSCIYWVEPAYTE